MLFRRRTFPRWLFVIPIGILILIGGGIAFARGRPTVTSVFPAPDTVAVPGLAPVRITFSRTMNQESVTQNLAFEPEHSGEVTWDGNTATFTPTAPWPGGEVVTVTLGTGARSSPGIPLAEKQVWSFTVARTMLAYLWPASGPSNLYILDPVGGDVVQLTQMGGVLEFSVATDGLFIFFSAVNDAGGSSLWQLDMVTRESALILECGTDLCTLPQPSADGVWLVYENTTKDEIWMLPVAGGEATFLGKGTRPTWAVDGKLALYDLVGKAFRVMDPDGESDGAVLLTSFPNEMGEPGAWSPDGSFFTAPETDAGADSSHLMAFLSINGITTNLSGEELVEDTSPAYSPDGKWLAFGRKYLDAERWTPGRQLWVMEADGDNAHPLTDDEFYSHSSFAWSPDSQTIAFVKAHRTAPELPPELWIVNLDGSEPTRLVIGSVGPQWIP